KKLATTKQEGRAYPLLNQIFIKMLGLSTQLVEFINEKNKKDEVKIAQEKLVFDIKNQKNIFAPTSIFRVIGKSHDKLEKCVITLPEDVAREINNNKLLKISLKYLNQVIAAYTNLCDQYQNQKTSLAKVIGEENYLHALKMNSALRAKRSEFYLGQPFAQLSVIQISDYYESYLQNNSSAIISYLASMGIPHNEFLKLNRTQGGRYIPDVFVDGGAIGHPGFYLKKLNPNNDNEAL